MTEKRLKVGDIVMFNTNYTGKGAGKIEREDTHEIYLVSIEEVESHINPQINERGSWWFSGEDLVPLKEEALMPYIGANRFSILDPWGEVEVVTAVEALNLLINYLEEVLGDTLEEKDIERFKNASGIIEELVIITTELERNPSYLTYKMIDLLEYWGYQALVPLKR